MANDPKVPTHTPTPQREKVEKITPGRKYTNDQPARVFDPFKAPTGRDPAPRPKNPGKQ